MAQKRIKQLICWLMGDRAGWVIIGTWRWLWGMPVEPGGRVAEEVAREALQSIQRSVQHLTQAVAALIAAYQRAKEKYESKEKELQQAEQQALLAQQTGNQEAARLAISKAILIERLLPALKEQVLQAETVVSAAKEKLRREQEKLETYKVQMQNLKDLSEVNEALAAIARTSSSLDIDSARSQFELAQSSIEKNYLKTSAQLELSENPAAKLQADLDQMSLDDEIARRLEKLVAAPMVKHSDRR